MKEKSKSDLPYHLLPSFPLYLIQTSVPAWLTDDWADQRLVTGQYHHYGHQTGEHSPAAQQHYYLNISSPSHLDHLDYVLELSLQSSVTNMNCILTICDGGINTSDCLN